MHTYALIIDTISTSIFHDEVGVDATHVLLPQREQNTPLRLSLDSAL